MAFILGGIIIVGALGIAALMVFAAGMSDNPTAADDVGRQALGVLIGGVVFGGLIIGSHWIHIGW
jgi:Kef-type K+ transport system membrane component KefB